MRYDERTGLRIIMLARPSTSKLYLLHNRSTFLKVCRRTHFPSRYVASVESQRMSAETSERKTHQMYTTTIIPLINGAGNVGITYYWGAFPWPLLPRKRGITHYEGVCSLSYPPCNAHAPYYTIICCLSVSTYFSTLFHERQEFRTKK